jgi:hypothetical protein
VRGTGLFHQASDRPDNRRVLHPVLVFEAIQQPPDLIIASFYQAHIGGNNRLADVVTLKGLTDLVGHELGVNRVRIYAFFIGADRRLEAVLTVHVIIGRGHDIGPMWFDIGQLTQEAFGWIAAL